jgi:hypothetical protein
MYEHGSGMFSDSVDVVFGYIILIMGIDAAEGHALIIGGTCLSEGITGKNAIVYVVLTNGTVEALSKKFITLFGMESFVGAR